MAWHGSEPKALAALWATSTCKCPRCWQGWDGANSKERHPQHSSTERNSCSLGFGGFVGFFSCLFSPHWFLELCQSAKRQFQSLVDRVFQGGPSISKYFYIIAAGKFKGTGGIQLESAHQHPCVSVCSVTLGKELWKGVYKIRSCLRQPLMPMVLITH